MVAGNGQTRRGRTGAAAQPRSRTWGKGSAGWDDSFKRTRYGYPSTSARLAMQASASRRARNRVVGSKLTHNATLGYISRGAALRSGLDDPGWTRYLPVAIAGAILVAVLAGVGYAGHGENLSRFVGMFRGASLAAPATEIVSGAQSQTGVASSRAIVAAASTYADAQKEQKDQKGSVATETDGSTDGSADDGSSDGSTSGASLGESAYIVGASGSYTV